MKEYLERQEHNFNYKLSLWNYLAYSFLFLGVLARCPAAAAEGPGEPLCQLTELARTALRTANHGMALVDELEKSIDHRLNESKSAFRSCEQDESCRTSSRLRDLEEAFNQAHSQKQRMASAHNEAVQRKAELEARFRSLKNQAVEAGCQALEAPGAAQ